MNEQTWKIWTLSTSIQTGVSSIRYSDKLGSGLRQFRSSSLSNCFKQAIHVPPFDVDGFETWDGKLVYNVLKKKLVLISRSNLPESFTDHIQRAFVFHYRVLILQKSKMNEQ